MSEVTVLRNFVVLFFGGAPRLSNLFAPTPSWVPSLPPRTLVHKNTSCGPHGCAYPSGTTSSYFCAAGLTVPCSPKTQTFPDVGGKTIAVIYASHGNVPFGRQPPYGLGSGAAGQKARTRTRIASPDGPHVRAAQYPASPRQLPEKKRAARRRRGAARAASNKTPATAATTTTRVARREREKARALPPALSPKTPLRSVVN